MTPQARYVTETIHTQEVVTIGHVASFHGASSDMITCSSKLHPAVVLARWLWADPTLWWSSEGMGCASSRDAPKVGAGVLGPTLSRSAVYPPVAPVGVLMVGCRIGRRWFRSTGKLIEYARVYTKSQERGLMGADLLGAGIVMTST